MVLALVTVPPLINSSPSLDALADTVTLPELVKVPSLPNSISRKALLPDVAPAKTLPLTALVMLLPPMNTSTSLNTVACAAIVLLLTTLLPKISKKVSLPEFADPEITPLLMTYHPPPQPPRRCFHPRSPPPEWSCCW